MKKFICCSIIFISFFSWKAQAQFFEGFEGSYPWSLPQGWSIIDGHYSGVGSTKNTSAWFIYSDVAIIDIGGTYDFNRDYLITPPIHVVDGATEQLSFNVKSDSPFKRMDLRIRVSTTGTNETDFSTIGTFNNIPFYWVNHTVDLSAYSGQQIYIAFYNGERSSRYTYRSKLFVDDIKLSTASSCIPPVNLTVGNIGQTTVDVSWQEFGTTAVVSWEMEYGPAGFDQATSGTILQDTDGTIGETISGLSPATEYGFYVRANCGSGDYSIWIGPYSFETLCTVPIAVTVSAVGTNTADISWTQSGDAVVGWEIEYGSAGFSQGNGTVVNASDGIHGKILTGLSPATPYDFYIRSNCNASNSNWGGPFSFTTTPTNDDLANATPLTVNAACADDAYSNWGATAQNGEPVGSCWAGGTSANTSVWFKFTAPGAGPYEITTDILPAGIHETQIAVYETPANVNDLSTLGTALGCDEDSGTLPPDGFMAVSNLTGLTPGNTYYIQVDGHTGFYPSEGDFCIEVRYCPLPTNLAANNITHDTAELSWTENGPASQWEIEYGPAGFTLGSGTGINDADGVAGESILGLAPSKMYEFYIRSECNADNNSWAGPVGFTTPCPAPVGLTINNVTGSSADVFWTQEGNDPESDGVVNWQIEYGHAGFNQATAGTILMDPDSAGEVLTGLSPVTAYDVYIRTHCGDGDYSNWIGPVSFSTLCATQTLPYFESFNADLGCFVVQNGGTTSHTWIQASSGGGGTVSGDLDGTGFAVVKSYGIGFEQFNESLISPYIDASNLGTYHLFLAFDQYFKIDGVDGLGEKADVEVWDGTWITVLSQSANVGGFGNPDHRIVDITAYANANLRIRFRYHNAEYDYYWLVDNVKVYMAPANDNLAGAIPLTINAVCSGDAYTNVGATTQFAEPIGSCWVNGDTGQNTVWFSFVAPANGAVKITTDIPLANSNVSQLAVYPAPSDSKDLSTLPPAVGCDENGGTELGNLVPGNTYYIQVDGYNGAEGGFCIEARSVCLAPSLLSVGEPAPTSAGLQWTETGTAVAWEIEYGKNGFARGSGTVVHDTDGVAGESLVGLTPSTGYQFYVRADCGVKSSPWAGPFSFTTTFISPDVNGIVYVKKNGAGNFSGDGWDNAISELAFAVKAAKTNSAIQEIWVAAGTYLPFYRVENGNQNPDKSFVLPANVKIYGGFAGTETNLSQRDLSITTNASVLSGDFNGDDGVNFSNYNENAYHVVMAAGNLGTAELNGFTIRGGNAFGSGTLTVSGYAFGRDNGGGIYAISSDPVFKNLKVIENKADWTGGAMNLHNSSPWMVNLEILRNDATHGIIYCNSSSFVLTNAVIAENTTDGHGAGMYVAASSPVLTNVVIYGNHAQGEGGAIFNYSSSTAKIRNSMIYGNTAGENYPGIADLTGSSSHIEYSLVQGLSTTGNGNIPGATNPLFTDPANGDFTLQTTSPVIDMGNDLYYNNGQAPDLSSITSDLARNDRFQQAHIDMGAFEYQVFCPKPTNLGVSGITATTADISWIENGTAMEWEIEYGVQGFNPATEGTVITDDDGTLGETITGLAPSTVYDFYVTAICSWGVTSGQADPTSFTTTPINDDLGDAVLLNLNLACSGDLYSNLGATAEPNEPVGSCFADNVVQKSVWFKFVAPSTGAVEISTDIASGTWNNSNIAVYPAPGDTSDLSTLPAQVACDEDGGELGPDWMAETGVSGLTPGNTYYIQVDGHNGATDSFCIEISDCLKPTNLTVANIGPSSADVGWTASAGQSSWEIEYGAAGFIIGTGTVVLDTDGAPGETIIGLSTHTDYEFYVRALCGTGKESASQGPFQFTTGCGAVGNFVENFQSSPTNGLPDCWGRIIPGSGSVGVIRHSFSNRAFLQLNGNNTTLFLVSPRLSNLSNASHRLLFSLRDATPGSTGSVEVGTLADPNDPTTFTAVAAYSFSDNNTHNITLNFTMPTSDDYIAFKGHSNGFLTIYIDDVVWEPQPGYYEYIYENGNWDPSDPSGAATATDDILVANHTTSLTMDTQVNNLTVNAGAILNIEAVLSPSGNIENNGSLVFVNTATKLGQLNDMTGSAITGSGEVTVQRYIPKRDVGMGRINGAYRYITSAVTTTASIRANWQEGGKDNNGFGMFITGPSGGASGFDDTPANAPSMFTWDNMDQAFEAVTNTDMDGLVAGVPYAAYVWGNRSLDIVTTGNDPEATDATLRATGSLKIGPQSNVNPFSTVARGYNFVGNPYQAIVDMGSVLGHSSNLNPNFYYVWDPNLGENGSYVIVNFVNGTISGSVPSDSEANQYLMPGQAVFVKTLNDGAASILFQESDKNVTADPTDVFRPENTAAIELQLFRRSFFVNGGPVADAFKIYFSEEGSNAVLPNDAAKLYNPDENVGLVNGDALLMIANRALPTDGESLQVFNNNYRTDAYVYKAVTTHLPAGTKTYLHDSYLDTDTELANDGETLVNFSVDETIPASIAKDRFSIVFSKKPLSVDNNLIMNGFSIYPNPVENNEFFILATGIAGEKVRVALYNLLGQQVYRAIREVGANARILVKTHNLQAGVYFVEMAHEGKTMIKKVIVQ